jgi:hypothetical protein
MSGSGVSPNIISFNSVISAHEKGRQWQRALHFLLWMFQVRLLGLLTLKEQPLSFC